MKAVSSDISGVIGRYGDIPSGTGLCAVPGTALHNNIYGHYELMPNAWGSLEFHEAGTQFIKQQRFLVSVAKLREREEC
jgi:hypothetical protein